jgi:hypothetical protein
MDFNPKQTLKENTLVKTKNNPKVYLIKNNQKHWILDEQTFNKLKYKWSNVVTVEDSMLMTVEEGSDME